MLVRATVTLLCAAAVEVWVVAATPVTTRRATKVRMAIFIEETFQGVNLSNCWSMNI